jgi:hypothetical protein
MNQLSWLLYFADAANSVKNILLAGSVFSTIINIFLGIFVVIMIGERIDNIKTVINYSKLLIVSTLVCSLIYAVIPSQNTVMMIAASEVGQKILETQSGQQATTEAGTITLDSLKLIHKFIQDKLVEVAPSK